jgi:hypothetical protein
MAKTPKKKKNRGLGRVRFLVHVDAVRAQMEQGWPKTAIYEKMADDLDMSYPQFLRYVREYIKRSDLKAKTVLAERAEQRKPAPSAAAKAAAETAQQERRQRGFVFDPMAVDKKDLI